MEKRIGIIISLICFLLNLSCYAQEYQADYNIIERAEEGSGCSYLYRNTPLNIRRSDINNIWWSGKEYIWRNDDTMEYSVSSDMQTWTPIQKTDGLQYINRFTNYTYDINYWGGKYIVFNRLYEDGVDLVAETDRGLTSAERPVLVLDDNFNIIKEVLFDNPITAVSYIDGVYYIRTQDYTNYKESGNPNNTIYKSADAITWTVDESLTEVPLKNSNGFGLIQSGSMQNGKLPYMSNIEEVARDNINKRTAIEYETTALKRFENMYEMYISYSRYYSDEEYKGFKYSIDGVYWLDVPYPEYLRQCDVSPNLNGTYYVESVYNCINLKDKLLFQTKYRLFEYDKNELITAWYNTFGNVQTYVELNDTLLGFETAPVIEDDRTLVPMRFLFEQMGADVEWNQETQTATATMNNTAVAFSINDTSAEVNGTAATMDVPARLINDKTMVPLRFLSEEMGYTVTWDEATRTAVIE